MAISRDQNLLTVQLNSVSAAIGARAAAKVARLGLDQRTTAVLFAVAELGRPSQQEIAVHTGIDRTTVSKTVDRLEEDRLVVRRIDPRHRRRHALELTASGTRTLERVQQLLAECDAEFLTALSETEQRQLARILRKLRDV
jgi:MarR family transcriptional regulator, lower aerobic nicotinate degradation pathway regulator